MQCRDINEKEQEQEVEVEEEYNEKGKKVSFYHNLLFYVQHWYL